MAKKSQAAQEFVPIEEIRSGVVILKDGSLRAVLLTSSLNFGLKSEDEQNAIILQFQNFLNSLEFPIQIFIQSRELDIRPYMALLEDRYTDQESDLMKIQTREYINFIKGFVGEVNVMSKRFFVVVPYTGSVVERKGGPLANLIPREKTGFTREGPRKDAFDEHRSQLEQRVSVVESGLARTGIRVAQLGTEELVELYYKMFNPGELGKPLVTGQVGQ